MRYNKTIFFFLFCAVIISCESDESSADLNSGTGQGGSMTRFAVNGNYMYVVDNHSIKVFGIGD